MSFDSLFVDVLLVFFFHGHSRLRNEFLLYSKDSERGE